MNKIKTLIYTIKEKIVPIYNRWIDYQDRNFGNTNRGVYWLSTLLCSIIVGLLYADIGLPWGLGFILATVVSFFLVNILFYFIIVIAKLLLKLGVNIIVYLSFLIAMITILMINGSSGNLSTELAVISTLVMVVILQLFVRSIWAFVKNKIRSKTIVATMFVTGILVIMGSVFLFGQGFQDNYLDDYLELNQKETVEISDFKAETKQGKYTVETIDYGMSENVDIKSATFNMSPYVGGYDGLQGFYRKLYQGYDIKGVPLAGRIWYPKEVNNCPVMFIAHGNHSFTVPSYLGYDYLGEFLASHGYVVVSVDENFCNACDFGNLASENDGRAVLLLENIKQVQRYNKDENDPLYQKMDYNNIAIAGHSRGGEMIAIAALFNKYTHYPSNGNIRFNYNFNIKSLLAIAPSVNQYKPAGHEVKLTDVNYLLIHGANDQDVSTFMGSRQYKNITFTGDGDYFKSYLYIAGANHGQFNSRWGKYDMIAPINQFLNVKNLMEESQQQNILNTFTKVYLDVTLKDKTEYKDLFCDYEKYKSSLPNTLYIQNYVDSGFTCMSDYEEDSDLTTATNENVTLKAFATTIWTEEMTVYSNLMSRGERGNYALRLKWAEDRDAKYELDFESYNASNSYLQFDILDLDDEQVTNKNYRNLDCTITLKDDNGSQVSTKLSNYSTIYPPLPVKLGKLQYIFNKVEFKHQFQTVRIPLDELSVGSDFDTSKINKILFTFDQEGSKEISMDNIGFSKY